MKIRMVFLAVFLAATLLPADAGAIARRHKTFPVYITIDFGPAGKPLHQGMLFVEKGTTPKEAVSQVFPVLSGKTCCDSREVMAIDGVKVDPAKNMWWTCKVNDSKKVSPIKKKLKSGDRVEWKYIQDSQ
ncbi:MAG: hypothetical protein A3C35_05675 [Omnitrophica bacterium RIFCSPHIGHO2_02_FULL_46_11]|nr:MAG: hypothetical protein A3A81_04280 [Omnitrophica bacterium RIFCSPLOWO2_01_FULL_45_10b]OGW86122.1 MAG: hypothetical protein A3C35_05675 [Omnitrophica bacterium RIFCSPHIGHO2_02_FULL_46_11]